VQVSLVVESAGKAFFSKFAVNKINLVLIYIQLFSFYIITSYENTFLPQISQRGFATTKKTLLTTKLTKDTKKRKEKGGRWRNGERKKLIFLPFTVSPFSLIFVLYFLCELRALRG
jgi:hypothetical protein